MSSIRQRPFGLHCSTNCTWVAEKSPGNCWNTASIRPLASGRMFSVRFRLAESQSCPAIIGSYRCSRLRSVVYAVCLLGIQPVDRRKNGVPDGHERYCRFDRVHIGYGLRPACVSGSCLLRLLWRRQAIGRSEYIFAYCSPIRWAETMFLHYISYIKGYLKLSGSLLPSGKA